MLRQLPGVAVSPEKAFETRNKIMRKALVDPEIDNTDKLVIRVNQQIDKGLITHELSTNIITSCVMYGKEGTMRRIESGTILKPINVNLSSRKKPEPQIEATHNPRLTTTRMRQRRRTNNRIRTRSTGQLFQADGNYEELDPRD
ncbi:hypothetical protein GNI_211930 [Gregarina niphandrodes]|uniref:Uncharacterized protein n=1 Tax=Gregarina niphandrodes TaxID=110365 RepID=A0A023AWF2_GRENI|nr:hypothetical protein GNI_211930 [Gregarina niphandrodes]EZG42892.1 hypothetical protein GNI_211930 [Gregarina niphandrodes]|eukprot:XP_011133829.1 hypothetical protein GNI_211930 [Gregarina niphandrodes]